MEDKSREERFRKYRSGEVGPEEADEIRAEFVEMEAQRAEIDGQSAAEMKDRVWDHVHSAMTLRPQRFKFIRTSGFKRVAAAAAILLVISVSFLHFNKGLTPRGTTSAGQAPGEVQPGRNQAILALADGRKVLLDQQKNGELAYEQGTSVTKTDDGSIIYSKSKNNLYPNTRLTVNTISTPRGGEFKITLPDGTRVWLNAASDLTFPVDFEGQVRREVTLKGEAYFEVSKDKKHPFVVHSGRETVEVLGTHFNINTYDDERNQPQMITTLLEGSVKVTSTSLNSEKILQPGQKAILHQNNGFVIGAADPYAVAWKDGIMRFDGANIKQVMREISRWYDLDVIYKGEISESDQIFAGLPRNSSLTTVLAVLRGVGVQFTIDASSRRITVQGK